MSFLNKGSLLGTMKRYKESMEQFDKAIELGPEVDKIYFANKAYILFEMKKFEEAVVCLNKAIQLNPYESEYYFHKIASLTRMKEHNEAIKCYFEGLKIDRNFFASWPGIDRIFGFYI